MRPLAAMTPPSGPRKLLSVVARERPRPRAPASSMAGTAVIETAMRWVRAHAAVVSTIPRHRSAGVAAVWKVAIDKVGKPLQGRRRPPQKGRVAPASMPAPVRMAAPRESVTWCAANHNENDSIVSTDNAAGLRQVTQRQHAGDITGQQKVSRIGRRTQGTSAVHVRRR